MAIDKNSTGYIYTFTFVLVAIVAVVLAGLAEGLKPMQNENIANEKRKFILMASGLVERDASLSKEEITEQFNAKMVTSAVLVYQEDGSVVEAEGENAFGIDIVKEYKAHADAKDRRYPIFVMKNDAGEIKFVIPMAGKGLWGPIWAYAAIDSDANSFVGAVFDHKSETPGLGGEIKDGAYFYEQFDKENGKKLRNAEGKYKGIKAVKGGAAPDDINGVDAIAGATITSVGASTMMQESFKAYMDYMENFKE